MSEPNLFDLLCARAVIDERGVNDHPKRKHCMKCGLIVWAAWRNGCGPVAIVDDVALTPRGEFEALMAHRETFDHWADGLDERTPEFIRKFPASTDPTHVVRPFHVCHAAPLDTYETHRKAGSAGEPPF